MDMPKWVPGRGERYNQEIEVGDGSVMRIGPDLLPRVGMNQLFFLSQQEGRP